MMLHLLYGPDDFSCTEAVSALIAGFAAAAEGAQISRYDAGSAAWPAIREACLALALFAPAQVVVVRGLLGLWSGRAEGGGKTAAKPSAAEFAAFVRDLPESTQLVLQESDLSAANRYVKDLSALPATLANFRQFELPREAARSTWITRRVRALGGSIAPAAAALLARRCGGDLWTLSGEVDKLLVYNAPLCSISEDDVATLVPAPDDGNAFDLVDAVTSRQERRVVDLLQRLLDGGEAPEAILALVGGRIRDLSLLAAAQMEGLAPSDVQGRAGWNPGRLAHLTRLRQEFTFPALREAQALLIAADLALKSRPTHERPLIALLTLLAITQRRPAAELAAALAY